MRKSQVALASVALATLIGGLSGCAMASPEVVENQQEPQEQQEWITHGVLAETTVTLEDGRTITCLSYSSVGSLSCDWVSAAAPR